MPRCHADGQVSSALRPRFPSSRGLPRRFDGPIVIHPPPSASNERPDENLTLERPHWCSAPSRCRRFLAFHCRREQRDGSAELLVLSLVEQRPRHGFEIGKLIETRSGGRLQFRIGSLYPILCRLEARGLLAAASLRSRAVGAPSRCARSSLEGRGLPWGAPEQGQAQARSRRSRSAAASSVSSRLAKQKRITLWSVPSW